MKTLFPSLFLIFVVGACSKKPALGSAALPDNVVSDKPIILKNGQSVILMKEGNQNLMIRASVTDGDLTVAEIDQKDRNFGVTWKNADSWLTSTIVKDGSNITTVWDMNGDGYADFRTYVTPSGIFPYELQGDTWIESKPKNKKSEQGGGGQPATRPESK